MYSLTLYASNVKHHMLGGATQPTTTKQIPRQVIKRKIAVAPEEIMKIRLAVALVGLAFGFDIPIFAQQKDTSIPKFWKGNHLNTLTSHSSFDFTLIGNICGQLASSYQGISDTFVQWRRVPACGIISSTH
jgi:hypothetical protein